MKNITLLLVQLIFTTISFGQSAQILKRIEFEVTYEEAPYFEELDGLSYFIAKQSQSSGQQTEFIKRTTIGDEDS